MNNTFLQSNKTISMFIKTIMLISIMLITTGLLAISLCGCNTQNNTTLDKDTSGTKPTPAWLSDYENTSTFTINTPQQLVELSQFINGTFNKTGDFSGKSVVLDTDIIFNCDKTATSSCMDGAAEFWPIGAGCGSSESWFCGEFDGRGHTISGIYCKGTSNDKNIGLFAGVSDGAYIHDFRLSNSFLESNTKNVSVGLIGTTADSNKSKAGIHVSNIYIDCDVYFNAQNDAGGIIAVANNTNSQVNVSSCVFAGVSKSPYQQTNYEKKGSISFQSNSAGIIGNAKKSNVDINNCLSMGFVMGGTNCSGIAGNADGNISINNCIDVCGLQCGSKSYGYRLYGGNSLKDSAPNPNATINNCIYLTNGEYGILSNKSTNSNLISISSIDEVKSHVSNLSECSAISKTVDPTTWAINWGNSNGNFDVIVPSTITNFAPNSVYCDDEITISDPVITQKNGDFISGLTYTLKIDKNTFNITDNNLSTFNVGIVYSSDGKEASESNANIVGTVQNNNGELYCSVNLPVANNDIAKTFSVKGFVTNTTNNVTILSKVEKENSLNDIAWEMFSDVMASQDDTYQYQVEDQYFKYKYSPYTSAQRQQLDKLITDKPIKDPESIYSTPESVGISSDEITGIMQDMADRGLNLHTMMIMRHGKIINEKYSDEYKNSDLQRMYSVSKSVVGISMCLLLSDSRYDVKLTDPVGKYFPEYADCDPVILNTTIEQCMTMTTTFDHGVYKVGDKTQNNWLDTFFKTPIDKDPNAGEFWYDTCGSYVIGVLVERVTGMTFLEYANNRAFNQIGVNNETWCVNAPEGYPWGGSGVMFTTKNMMDVGNLMMCQGQYQGQQLINRDIAINATSNLIDDSEEGYSFQDGRGYGYYTWITDFGFAFLGMGNQVYFAIPSLDMAFVCTSDNQGNSLGYYDIFELIARRLIANAKDGALPQNDKAYKKLQDYKIHLQTQKGERKNNLNTIISENTYTGGSDSKISEFNLDIEAGKLTYTCHGESGKTIDFGVGSNKIGTLDETGYCWKTINKPMTEDGRNVGYRTACSGAWKDDKTFVIFVQIIDDYLANMTMTFSFNDDGSSVKLTDKYTAEGFLDEYKMSDAEFSKNN